MKLFEGKSPEERNKIIAAIVLGVLAVLALGYNFIGFSSGRKTTVNVKASPSPASSASPSKRGDVVTAMPNREQTDFVYESTPIDYAPGSYGAPGPGRNIFAFYEPPPPTPYSPTPTPPPVVKTPVPTPTPPQTIVAVMPQSVYAGSKGFRLEVNGDKFTPESRILFNQNEMPTTFVSAQRLTTDIPANFISNEGPRMILVRTPDGKLYSDQTSLTVMAPPKPTFTYIGPVMRKRSNNDTAYIMEQGGAAVGKRLNDIIGGRFRLVSISTSKVVVEDINLGFRHDVAIAAASSAPMTSTSNRPTQGFPNDGTYVPYNPNQPQYNQQNIPGIPNNIPRYVPPNSNQQPKPEKKDVDDDDDDGDGRP